MAVVLVHLPGRRRNLTDASIFSGIFSLGTKRDITHVKKSFSSFTNYFMLDLFYIGSLESNAFDAFFCHNNKCFGVLA